MGAPKARAIVRATIDFARALDLTLVAEGIETADVLALLIDAGCDVGQGYYISRPHPLRDLLPMLDADSRITSCPT